MTFQTPVPDDTDPRAVEALRHQLTAFAHQIDASPSLHDVLGHRRRQHRQRIAVAAAAAVAVAVAVPTFGLRAVNGVGPRTPASPPSPSGPSTPFPVPTGRLDDADFAAYVKDQIRHARGEVDDADMVTTALQPVKASQSVLIYSGIGRLLWGGHRQDGGQVLVVAVQLTSGRQIAIPFQRSVYSHQSVLMIDPSAPLNRNGLVAFALTVDVNGRVRDNYVLVGPPDAVRYEIQTPGETLRGALDDGGAVVETPGDEHAKVGARVSVFDRRGRLLAQSLTIR